MDVHWSEGAEKCTVRTEPPLQVHAYNSNTYILRESLCSTFEAPFMYLLIGSKQALLVDTGDVADPKQMPLAETVMNLLPQGVSGKLPLLVVHSHRHLDHRAGDSQFATLPNVRVVGFDLQSVRQFYGFSNWPNGTAEIDLGDRTVDAIPSPGHNETEVTFYDRNTGLLLTGDFLLPARLLVDDSRAYKASAERVADFVKDRQVTYVLGGHIEMDANGNLFPWQSPYHPHEHVLQLSKNDVLAFPKAVSQFNGFYTQVGNLEFMDSIRILEVCGVAIVLLLATAIWMLIRYLRRRRATAQRVAHA
jgi:glyoxylase-like metal-dependent hydrolase (beta-lactamase superfamily II)